MTAITLIHKKARKRARTWGSSPFPIRKHFHWNIQGTHIACFPHFFVG